MRRKIDSIYGKNTKKTRNVIKNLNKEAFIVRKEIEENHEEKVEHLLRKFREESKKEIPENLSRYKELSIYMEEENAETKENNENNYIKIMILGEIEIDENEESVLKLPPDYSIYEKLSDEEFCLELELSNTKYRWAMRDEEDADTKDGEEEIPTEEERELFERMEAESRQYYDPVKKEFDVRKKRVTDLKENSKVILPKPLKTSLEARISLRRDKYISVYKEYKKENCNSRDEQRLNLTFSQKKGLLKLRKRIKDSEIVIMLTDKSGKFVITTPEIHDKMGEVHTRKDREISEEKVKELQRYQNGHVAMWLKMGQVGANWDHQDRFRETCINQSSNVSSFSLLVKDHKKVPEGELPSTRPLCNGSEGMGVHFSNLLSDYVEPIANEMEDTIEVTSTEDFISKINEFNHDVMNDGESGNRLVVTGADAKALYPSLKIMMTAHTSSEQGPS